MRFLSGKAGQKAKRKTKRFKKKSQVSEVNRKFTGESRPHNKICKYLAKSIEFVYFLIRMPLFTHKKSYVFTSMMGVCDIFVRRSIVEYINYFQLGQTINNPKIQVLAVS